jgi:hypothetical protein
MADTMPVDQYFSTTYAEARQRFLIASRAFNAHLESFQNPLADGEPLFTDVALFGSRSAEKFLVIISGTHGVEGFTGSGIQLGLLQDGLAGKLGADVSLLMIHALNPYGFAKLRRVNEDNVDLNRNFLDHALGHPENSEYAQLADAIAPRTFSLTNDLFARARLLSYRLQHGRAGLQKAVSQGQYEYPQGLFYGGRFATWSNRILRETVGRYLGGAARVVVVDLHTGLGPYGYGEIIIDDPVASPAGQRAVSWWGKERVKSTVSGESVSARLTGTIELAFAGVLPEAMVTTVVLEFGTLSPMQVFMALRAENWLHHHGRRQDPLTQKIRQRFLRAFYPDDELWKARVLEQGRLVVDQVLVDF